MLQSQQYSKKKQDQPTNTEESHQLNELQTHQLEQLFLVNSSDENPIQFHQVRDQLQISKKDQSLNMNEFNQPNQHDLELLSDHQQIDDQENNKSDPIPKFTEGQGHGNRYKKQWTKPVKNDSSMEKALILSLESLYDKNKSPRQIGDYIMKQDINPSSVYRNEKKDSRIKVVCKYNQNEQKVKIEINNIIYDPIKCQIYLTDARGKPERNRPERKRKMISKIVETRSLNYE